MTYEVIVKCERCGEKVFEGFDWEWRDMEALFGDNPPKGSCKCHEALTYGVLTEEMVMEALATAQEQARGCGLREVANRRRAEARLVLRLLRELDTIAPDGEPGDWRTFLLELARKP